MSDSGVQIAHKNDGHQQTIITTDKSKKQGCMLVAAIDFGTTFSGYAFCVRSDFEKDKTKISMNQKWTAGCRSLISLKAPTAVLFDPNGKFHSFGFKAEDKYADLAADDDHRGWYFFGRFKMGLHEKKVTRDMEILDESKKKTMKAVKVFGAIISYLKHHLLDTLGKRGSGFVLEDIHWILTVPAIWTDSAKQFMREAACAAGIDGELLSIALEPEAASLYCQLTHDADVSAASKSARLSLASPGAKYMVIDLGGGTADITVHERQIDGTLKEMHKATGGAWGGTKVDEEFYQLLIRIVGAPVFTEFCDKHKAEHLDLQREFETKKRTIAPDSTDKISMRVPSELAKMYKKEYKETVQTAIDGSPFRGKITWEKDKIRMKPDVFKNLFQPCTESIVAHVKDLLKNPRVEGTKIFLMVGGFSESELMQSALRETFPDVKVVIPEDAGLTVVKGAVVFGLRPGIDPRVSKYTYGINISPPFDPALHPEDHRVSVGGIDRCRDVFKKYIREGETVYANDPRKGKHITLKPFQKEMLLKIFASPRENPMFVDEKDCDYLGNLVVKLPESRDKIRVHVSMMFGDTELTVEAEEDTNHTKFKAFFDFL